MHAVIARDLILPLQIGEEAACILVLGCTYVEHDQIFTLQLEKVGHMLVSDCLSFNPEFPYYCAFQ